MYACHPSPTEGSVLTKLFGRKCTIQCLLNGVRTSALWDTGAQVSIVSTDWISKHLPHAKLQPVEELLVANELDLKAANGTAECQ